MTAPNASPIVLANVPFVSGLTVTNNGSTPDTKIDVAAGSCMDSTNTFNIILSSSVTVNTANNGLNGLDTGSLAASTWYYLHAIGDPVSGNVSGAMLSLSATAPTMPFGYSVFKLIDYVYVNGSTHIAKFTNTGSANSRFKYWDTLPAATFASSGASTSLALVDLSGGVPPVEPLLAMIDVSFTPATANDTVGFAVVGSSATVLQTVSGVVAAKVQSQTISIPAKLSSGIAQCQYINSAGSGLSAGHIVGFGYTL